MFVFKGSLGGKWSFCLQCLLFHLCLPGGMRSRAEQGVCLPLATTIVALRQALLLNWMLGNWASKLRTPPDFSFPQSTGATGMHSYAQARRAFYVGVVGSNSGLTLRHRVSSPALVTVSTIQLPASNYLKTLTAHCHREIL